MGSQRVGYDWATKHSAQHMLLAHALVCIKYSNSACSVTWSGPAELRDYCLLTICLPVSSVHRMNSPGKNTGVGSCSFLQGIFPTQGSNPVSHIAGRFFTIWATKEPPKFKKTSHSKYLFWPTMLSDQKSTIRGKKTAKGKRGDSIFSKCSKSFKLGFNIKWTKNFQMYKLDLEKAEEPEIKSPKYIWSHRKWGNSRNISNYWLY